MNELPEGWISSPLEYLAEQITKGTTPTTLGFDYKEAGVNFVKIENINNNKIQRNTISQFISNEAHETLSRSSLEEYDVLFSIAGTIGKTALVTQEDLPANTNQAIAIIRVNRTVIDHGYLQYQLNALSKDFLIEKSRGGAMSNISLGDIRSFETHIAPLNEQTRIAQKLDDLLAQVDTLKARIDAIPAQLKRFRQSVLAAAVSGRLTEEWRTQQAISTIDLKREHSQPPSELHAGWSFRKLPELGELARGKSKHRPRNDKKLFGSEYPFIQTGEVANSVGHIDSARIFYSEFGLAQSRLFPRGTLCITIAANIADTAILNIDACFPDSVVGFIPLPMSCEVIFIKYLIDVNKQNLEDFAPATAQKNINLKILRELSFPMPPYEEQTEVVRRVEQLFTFANQLEAKVASAKSRIDHLTQSILAKAFRGELVPQDPNDEPASALLERIKAQRAAAPKAKRGQKGVRV